jgi:hypothetical protein
MKASGKQSCLAEWLCLPPAFTLVSCLVYASTLKMEMTCSSETSVELQLTTWRYVPEDRNLQVKSGWRKFQNDEF